MRARVDMHTNFLKSKQFKIRDLLIISISILLVIITILVSVVTYRGIRKILENNMYIYIDEMIRKTAEGIDSLLHDIDTMALYVLQDRDIGEALKVMNETGKVDYDNKLLIENKLKDYKMPFWNRYKSIWLAVDNTNSSIGVLEAQNAFNPEVDTYLLNEFIEQSKSFESGKTVWTGIYEFNRSRGLDSRQYVYGDMITNESFFAIKNMRSLENFKSTGTLIVEVEGSFLKSVINNILSVENAGVILLESSGKAIFSNQQDLTDQTLAQNIGRAYFKDITLNKSGHFIYDKNFYSYSTSQYTGWKLVGIFPFDNIYGDILKVQQIILVVSVIGIIVGIFITTFLSLNIEKPIKSLVRKMDAFKVDNLDLSFNTSSHITEITFLNTEVSNLFTKIKVLISDIISEQKKERELELKVLQLQINPHFLYNTLDTLHWKMILSKENETAEAVVALSNLLRYSISKGGGLTTVKEELSQLQNYITIQRLRFGNRFDVEISMDLAILDCSIPKLTFQPIVENAINHGLKGRNNYGKLVITGRVEKDYAFIMINDNGIGIQEDCLKKIQNQEYESNGTGLGIKNVNERILLQLGIQDAVRIESQYGVGTTVYIKLALRHDLIMPLGEGEC